MVVVELAKREHAAWFYGGVGGDCGLDIMGEDVAAVDDNDFFDAAENEQFAIIEKAEIAGV